MCVHVHAFLTLNILSVHNNNIWLRYSTGDEDRIGHMMATVIYGTIKEFDPESENLPGAFATPFQSKQCCKCKRRSLICSRLFELRCWEGSIAKNRKAIRTWKKCSRNADPKPLVNFHFYKQAQAEGESLAEDQAELRWLARTCEFKRFLKWSCMWSIILLLEWEVRAFRNICYPKQV